MKTKPAPKEVDTLTKWFREYLSTIDQSETYRAADLYQAFLAGVNKGSASMRLRAMECCLSPGLNLKQEVIEGHIRNEISKLVDIPE